MESHFHKSDDHPIDESQWPILVIRSPAEFDEKSLKSTLDELAQIYRQRKEPYVLVIDGRSGRRPNALQRKIENEFRKEWESHVQTYCKGTAFVWSLDNIRRKRSGFKENNYRFSIDDPRSLRRRVGLTGR